MNALIVTADDVGLHRGMTQGAIDAHRYGIVTACSIAPCGAAFEHAVDSLRPVTGIDVGAHLMLVEGRPLLPPAAVRTLVQPNGHLLPDFRRFIGRYVVGRISLDEVERELSAQLERLAGTGLRLAHVNSHQHLHLLPGVFEIVVRLARTFSIPFVRVVRDAGGGGGPLRRVSVHALSVLGRRMDTHGLRTSDRTIGVAGAGHLSSASLVALLDRVEGVTELVAHPGVGNRELAATYRWKYDWEAETAALCDPVVRRAIDARGIRLRGI